MLGETLEVLGEILEVLGETLEVYKMKKVFVDVVVKYTKEGSKVPLTVIWENGRKYSVDRVLEIKQAASMKVGGQGMRYKCRISGQETCLWLEDEKWFVEAR